MTDVLREIGGKEGKLGVEVVGGGGEFLVLFLDDWENDLFVCVVGLDDVRTRRTETPSQYKMTWRSRRLTS